MKEKELLKTVRHIAMSTVNEDGTPHNTPLFFAFDESIKRLYFASRPDSLHCINLLRTGVGYAVVYNSNEFMGGIYLTVDNCRIAADKELGIGLKCYLNRCDEFGIDVLPPEFHLKSEYRLFMCDVSKIEIYSSEVDASQYLKQETRREISAKELSSV